MNHLYFLYLLLVALLIISSFFSGAETSMMAINRYRLRHLVKKNNPAAKRVSKLLERPDRLLGVILIGNTFANMMVSSVTTLIAISIFGDSAVVPATLIISLVVLIFGEITPKTLAALYPERFAFPASGLLTVILKIFYPLVLAANGISNAILRIFRIRVGKRVHDELSHEEMKTLVHEAASLHRSGDKHMMLGVLDLSAVKVDDIKIPRNDIIGIDMENDWLLILKQLSESEHTRLPLYRESIDQVYGILHLRKAMNLLAGGQLNKDALLNLADEIHFIPEGTPLNVQLVNFRKEKQRIGLIVDEYGDIQGLLTLEDILEEIVGEFTTNLAASYKNIQKQKDGSYLVDGSVNIRELNRRLNLELSNKGPKTLSGLIVEYFEAIPAPGLGLRLEGYPVEVLEVEENTVKLVRIWPSLYLPEKHPL